jgi:hypothetical protein
VTIQPPTHTYDFTDYRTQRSRDPVHLEHTSLPQQGEEAPTNEPHFEPVIKLTEQVEVKTNEENEDVLFKM